MISIGIEVDSLLAYEGSSSWGRVILPTPVLAAAEVVSSSVPIIPNSKSNYLNIVPLIFREDSFDPVTRVRRGRFYRNNGSQPINWLIHSHPAMASERKFDTYIGSISKDLVTFHSCHVSSTYFEQIEGQPLVVIGSGKSVTIWTVVSTELSLGNEEIVVLRQRTTFGALPEMNWEKIPEQGKEQVRNTLAILSKEIFNAGPESVIDRARDAGSAILSAYLVDRTLAKGQEDLGKLVSILSNLPRSDRPNICMNGGDILAILHPRAKPSEQAMRPSRAIREQDAELAVQLVGTMLCDLGWADWR